MRFIQKLVKIKNWQFFLLLLLFGLKAYINVSGGDFVWDEKTLIVGNGHMHSLKYFFEWFNEPPTSGGGVQATNMYRPLSTVIYALTYAVGGLNTVPYHLVNIFLHIGNAFLTFIFLQRLSFARIGSMFAAFLFLLHPIQTEAVSYIAGLPDLLATLFILLGLNVYTNDKPLNLKRITYVAIFMVFAILSKEIGIIFLPLIILVILFKKESFWPKKKAGVIKTILTLGTLTCLYIILRLTILNPTDTFSLTQVHNAYTENILYRIYTFLAAIVEYLKLIIYPVHLYFEKPFNAYLFMAPKVWIGAIITLLGFGLSVKSYFKKKQVFFIYFWCAISIALVSGVFVSSNAAYKEHWLYVPMIGIVSLIPIIWEKLNKKLLEKVFIGVLCVLLTFSIKLTINRNSQWKDVRAFFENEIKYNPTSSRLYNELGLYYYEKENWEEAKVNFENGIRLNKLRLTPELGYNLGNTYLALHQTDAAIQMYLRTLQGDPNYLKAHISIYNLAIKTHNKPLADTFFSFMQRVRSGEKLNFEKDIAPLLKANSN